MSHINFMSEHHHTLRNQPFEQLHGIRVLLVEPESETRAFYTNQLENIAMQVIALDTLAALNSDERVHQDAIDVVIANPSEDISFGITQLKTFKQMYPSLPVITMTLTMPDDTLDAIMESGVSLHINRGLTRPRDLLLALEQVLSMK